MTTPRTHVTDAAGAAPPPDRAEGDVAEPDGAAAELVRRAGAWGVSVAVHAGLAIVAAAVTWTVVRSDPPEAAEVVVADFDRPAIAPPAAAPLETAPADPALPSMPEVEVPVEIEIDLPLDAGAGLPAPPPAAAAVTAVEGGTAGAPVEFVGLSASNARDVVYVIDASGSMIRSLPVVLEELERSLEGLTSEQRFAVVFFQGSRAIEVPPGRLVAASAVAVAEAMQWARAEVIPDGGSNPIAALEVALGLRPDAVFLLSENITGSGRFEVSQEALLARLETLNPVDPQLGRRAVRIQCVQFLDADPLDTLRRIAEIHGGPGGWKFLDRDELGLIGP